ncbi:MAG: chromosome segregation SMC family protein, partial [Elusimicrobiota bacterium]
MYLKRIKIFGFKSFAEESIFDFDKGITAVVGPNGCGKSNLLDAVNWVLGEQSAGRLRGNEMQDMIFKGSRTRKPLGVARVELMLDNSRNILPIDYDEVSVSRKLYRSGESEYFINKNPCRMKDIKELFLDTGIGTRSYSIMEQDNIKFILESSPVERRGILEEAAGIRKYKEKKLESERRLERIKDDLKEVKNIMAEVQKNIRKLRIQKNKAKKYRELKNRLRYFEVSRLCQEYTSIIKILNTKEKDSSELQKDIARVGSEKGKLEVEISELENKKTKMEEELLDKNHKVYKIESRMEILNSRIDDFDSSQERLNEEIQRLNKTLDFNKEKINKLAGEIERLEKTGDKRKQEELEELELKNDSLSQKKENFNARISELRRKIESDEKRLFHLKKKEVELINKKKNATQKSDELGNRKRELDKLIQEFGRKLDGKNTRLNNIQKEIDNIDEKRNNCKQEIKELDHKVI